MPQLRVNLLEDQALLDIGSYASQGPGQRDHLSPAQLEQISRTVSRVPEAVVKVLPKDANNFSSVMRHVGYIGRYGELELETDDGEHQKGERIGHELAKDWDLDLDEHRRQSQLSAAHGRQPPKLVHKLMLSMPAGTPPQGVLTAARNFLREEFALKHRFAFVLHTDEPHPHVHAVIKAVSEQGVRLHIRKATLRQWRREFARHLRDEGIAANATERAVRGENRAHKIDPIYRAQRRGDSSHMRERVSAIAAELASGALSGEPGKTKLVQTRQAVEAGWRVVGETLARTGFAGLAEHVNRFVDQMSPARTEKEEIAAALLARKHEPHKAVTR